MAKYRLRDVEVQAIQWRGPQDNVALRILCGDSAVDGPDPVYVFPDCWVVKPPASWPAGIRGVAVFSDAEFLRTFEHCGETMVRKLIPPQGGSSSSPPTAQQGGPATPGVPAAVAVNGGPHTADSVKDVQPAGIDRNFRPGDRPIVRGGLVVGFDTEATEAKQVEVRPAEKPVVGKLIPPQGGSGTIPPAVLPRGRSSNYTGPTAEQTATATATARPPVQPLIVVDRFRTRYTAVKWDGLAETANTFLGERYGIDWEYERVGSSAILLPTVDHGRKIRADVGHWIVKGPNEWLDSILAEDVMWDHFTPATEMPPPAVQSAVAVNGGPHTEESVRPVVACGSDGQWVSSEPPVLLPTGCQVWPAETPVVEYFAVQVDDSWELVEAVNDRLREGWEVQGGVAVHMDGTETWYTQAMVRRSAPPVATPPASPPADEEPIDLQPESVTIPRVQPAHDPADVTRWLEARKTERVICGWTMQVDQERGLIYVQVPGVRHIPPTEFGEWCRIKWPKVVWEVGSEPCKSE